MKASVKDLLSAIRKKCMDCCGNMRSEVQACRIKDCPLYPYRRNAVDDEYAEGEVNGENNRLRQMRQNNADG